jgi:hypothetical protein
MSRNPTDSRFPFPNPGLPCILSPLNNKAHRIPHRDELVRLFGIGAEDLDANRAGRLGERQRRRILASGMRNLAAALVIGLVVVAILLFVANRPLKAAQVVTAGVLVAAAMAAGAYDVRRTRAAAADGRVETLIGEITVRSRGQQGWWVDVAGRSFRVPVRPWNLKNGRAYRVYVAMRANRIVAMEPEGWE